jgi:isoleucyl-tRNA synthetase
LRIFKDLLSSSHPSFVELEKMVQEYWEKIRVNELIDNYREKAEKLYFLDGPPYPSADTIHVGTARNKVLKDIIIRYNILKGYNVFRVPGYDCHGLPVEMEAEKKLGVKNKQDIETKIGVKRFIDECRKIVKHNIEGMTKQFKRLGALFDWEHPYLTMSKEYMEAVWKMFKQAYEDGLVREELRPVWWCPRCRTVLSDYEVSDKYIEKEDPSIYVKFPLKDEPNTYLVIWTTTPWTLPANLAITVHPEYDYAFVKLPNGETWILAEKLVPQLMELFGIEEYTILKTVKGRELEGLRYKFILEDIVPKQRELEQTYPRVHTVILGEFVTLEDGTGLVHTAPGHGLEDWEVSRRYGIPVFSPVAEDGTYTEDVPALKGIPVLEANDKVIQLLEERGYLVYKSTIKHRYPVCWRCKTPLIQRAVKEIFIYRTKIKDKLKEIVEKEVKIYPSERKQYFIQMIERLPDWPIVRQRYWGIPIPMWKCPEGHTVVIGSAEELEKLAGKKIDDLHVDTIDSLEIRCPVCGKPMKRVQGVFDVWADSGAGSFALEPRAGKYPVDVILEGHDQFRGWFMSLLVEGYIYKKQRPYNVIVTQGWVYDKYGRGMSKSQRIGLLDDEAYERIGGADILRFYIISKVKPWEDLIYDEDEIPQVRQFFIVLWNIYRFARDYMRLDNFDPMKAYDAQKTLLDRMILARFGELVQEYQQALESYEFSKALKALQRFVLDDLSRFYVKLSRDRAWLETSDPKKWSFYQTLYYILKNIILLLVPFTPHIAEYLYQEFVGEFEKSLLPTVQLERFPADAVQLHDARLSELQRQLLKVIEAGLQLRDQYRLKLRWPLADAKVFLNALYEENSDLFKDFGSEIAKELSEILAKALNVKQVSIVPMLSEAELKELLAQAYAYRILELKDAKKQYFIGIALNTHIDRELYLEALAREINRRIQSLRKELNLEITDFIEVTIYTQDKDLLEAIEKFKDKLAHETRARSIKISNEPIDGKHWKIEGKEIVISIKKL